MPLSVGHITLLIAGQETGVLSLPSDNGTILVKGMSRKVVDVTSRDMANDKGEYSHTNVNEREKHVAAITIAHRDGQLDMLQSSIEVGDFITQYADPIAGAILQRNQPLYEFKPEVDEWQITSKSARGLPPLPNRTERGLFDVQRHFAIAAARVMKARRHCLLNAEMGFGKTATSIAALELMDEFPVLVMCPGHMVFKWQRDIERSSNPEEPITARVITRPVLDKPSTWQSSIQPSILSTGGSILETTRRQVNPESPNDPGGRRRVQIACSPKYLQAVRNVIQKLSFKDKEAGKTIAPQIRLTSQGLEAEFVDRDEYTSFDFYADYTAGRMGLKMKYAQLLHGKEAVGVLVETDADDIQREIINAALEGKAFRNAGEAVENLSIFATGTEREVQVTKSPMGRPIAASPLILPAWDLPSGKVYQLTLIPGFEPVPADLMRMRRRR